MAMDVAGKTAIVTGAGSGINLAFAALLLSKGCNVILADLALRPEAQEVVDKYTGQKSGAEAKAVFQKTDVTDWAQLDALFETATASFGGADIVCPGAGIYEPHWSNFWYPPGTEPSTDDKTKSRYQLLDINLTHPIRSTQAAIAHFYARNTPGTVIHISSIAGQLPFFAAPMYVATKHGISGFVRSMAALETPPSPPAGSAGPALPSVRVAAVAPGLVRTPLWTEHPEKLKMVVEGVDEWVTPEEVAAVMLGLVTGEGVLGGTVLEVGKNVRRVEPFGDPGPSGAGNTIGNVAEKIADVWSVLGSWWSGGKSA